MHPGSWTIQITPTDRATGLSPSREWRHIGAYRSSAQPDPKPRPRGIEWPSRLSGRLKLCRSNAKTLGVVMPMSSHVCWILLALNTVGALGSKACTDRLQEPHHTRRRESQGQQEASNAMRTQWRIDPIDGPGPCLLHRCLAGKEPLEALEMNAAAAQVCLHMGGFSSLLCGYLLQKGTCWALTHLDTKTRPLKFVAASLGGWGILEAVKDLDGWIEARSKAVLCCCKNEFTTTILCCASLAHSTCSIREARLECLSCVCQVISVTSSSFGLCFSTSFEVQRASFLSRSSSIRQYINYSGASGWPGLGLVSPVSFWGNQLFRRPDLRVAASDTNWNLEFG